MMMGTTGSQSDGDDRTPVPEMIDNDNVTGSLFFDKGYVSALLKADLDEQCIDFVTGQSNNIKPQAVSAWGRAMLSKRLIIEMIFDQLKNIAQIEGVQNSVSA